MSKIKPVAFMNGQGCVAIAGSVNMMKHFGLPTTYDIPLFSRDSIDVDALKAAVEALEFLIWTKQQWLSANPDSPLTQVISYEKDSIAALNKYIASIKAVIGGIEK